MAEEQPDTLSATGKVSRDEIKAAFSGAAIHADRFIVTAHPGGLRLAFLEKESAMQSYNFRAGVIVSYADAVALRNLLTQMLKPVETQLAEAAAHLSGGSTLSANLTAAKGDA